VRTAIGTVVIDVKLTEAERKALERITRGTVLESARLEVKVQVKVRKP
jgi:hypothetical protein